MKLKDIFGKAETENGSLTWEQFNDIVKANKVKFVDLNEGEYVSKFKYDEDLAAKDKAIETLNGTIAERDNDLAGLSKQLEEAGNDSSKLSTLSADLSSLQEKYDADIKNYQKQLQRQAYEFAVKDFANGKQFTSNAAKRDFIRSMIAKELKMENDKILGADDFVSAYTEENSDAFVVEEPNPDPTPTPDPLPTFVNPTPGGDPSPVDSNAFSEAFNFIGVRDKI